MNISIVDKALMKELLITGVEISHVGVTRSTLKPIYAIKVSFADRRLPNTFRCIESCAPDDKNQNYCVLIILDHTGAGRELVVKLDGINAQDLIHSDLYFMSSKEDQIALAVPYELGCAADRAAFDGASQSELPEMWNTAEDVLASAKANPQKKTKSHVNIL